MRLHAYTSGVAEIASLTMTTYGVGTSEPGFAAVACIRCEGALELTKASCMRGRNIEPKVANGSRTCVACIGAPHNSLHIVKTGVLAWCSTVVPSAERVCLATSPSLFSQPA